VLKTQTICFKKKEGKSDIRSKEVRAMAEEKEKKGKSEEVAEKTGEVLGKGLKKGIGIAKGIGKGLAKGVKGEEEKKE
jgi:hypothetical protein